ncbi:2-amino-4-hydroxy-6-hydroxymethyldihydropteridine pyrophosphokinase [Paraliobacillus quinghaiensis]|uniref:2-amino-4-hydroxy-6-hydroxymethyldihydropteridine diphosphokinase n=1 Tax=Paraliobacillus quinghaiensis TaxID=470815 RepID=A0A917TSP4_9BACI|nr:2-amino-4-hydroxy-6-hydroxymethyldihydropteridine diphosphokinase [Paraliobacillus quinghaiensis]GGM36385.1 2-amino-4-hydroxy-6-hydroxymethyldihydropteridine pyrophosphokinase [Paraliobacillus quinghaiensis]
MIYAYIALGSNIEPRFTYLQKAINALDQVEQLNVIEESLIYETIPVGYEEQANFLNMVVKIETSLKPFALLNACQKIERKLGRKREVKWGPRTIDLDILLYNQENMETEQLIIPHPRIEERAFVLIPLLDVNPSGKLPSSNKSIVRALADLPTEEKRGVVKWIQSAGEEG